MRPLAQPTRACCAKLCQHWHCLRVRVRGRCECSARVSQPRLFSLNLSDYCSKKLHHAHGSPWGAKTVKGGWWWWWCGAWSAPSLAGYIIPEVRVSDICRVLIALRNRNQRRVCACDLCQTSRDGHVQTPTVGVMHTRRHQHTSASAAHLGTRVERAHQGGTALSRFCTRAALASLSLLFWCVCVCVRGGESVRDESPF